MDVSCMESLPFVTRAQKQKETCKPTFTGHRGWQGDGGGLAQRLVWPFGCAVDVECGVVFCCQST